MDNPNKSLRIKGVTIYKLTDEALSKALHNPNSVILLASMDDVFTPTYYQRYADYLDKDTLEKAGFIEALTPYVIDPLKYPISDKYNVVHEIIENSKEE